MGFPDDLLEDLLELEDKRDSEKGFNYDGIASNYDGLAKFQQGIQDSIMEQTNKVIAPQTNTDSDPKFFTMKAPKETASEAGSLFSNSMDDAAVPVMFRNLNISVNASSMHSGQYVVVSPDGQNHQQNGAVGFDVPMKQTNDEPNEDFQFQEVQFVNSQAIHTSGGFQCDRDQDAETVGFAEASPASSELSDRNNESRGVGRKGKPKDPDNSDLKKKIRLLDEKKARNGLSKNEESALHRLRNNLSCRESRQTKSKKEKEREATLKQTMQERDTLKKKCDNADIILNSLLVSENVPDNVKQFINQQRLHFA